MTLNEIKTINAMRRDIMQYIVITGLLILTLLLVGMIEGDTFTECAEQDSVTYETCLAAHNIK